MILFVAISYLHGMLLNNVYCILDPSSVSIRSYLPECVAAGLWCIVVQGNR